MAKVCYSQTLFVKYEYLGLREFAYVYYMYALFIRSFVNEFVFVNID